MSDIKFSCPACQQHIQADQGYAGMQINCPACNTPLIIPAAVAIAHAPAADPSSAYTLPRPPPTPRAPGAGGCPSCGNPLPHGAVLCTRCGYNLETKQRVVAGRVLPMGADTAASRRAGWYKTAYPYIGVLVLVLGALYYAGKTNPRFCAIGFVVLCLVLGLYLAGMHFLVLIAAFQEGLGTGLLTLCVPFYFIYYIVRVNKNSTLKVLYLYALIIPLIILLIMDLLVIFQPAEKSISH